MSHPAPNGFRNVSNGSGPTVTMNGRQAQQSTPQQQRDVSPALSRAERFEDEKKRIIESCFSKVDESGQLQESYITHIRILEDAAFPSTPPPPDSPQDNKKPRIIIVAVRNTGRVRMHKARENNNGTFSVGKTWNLEELSAIESFSNVPTAPRDDREAQFRTWAGSVGFTVTITKPYYWQAGSSKEKDFFIASAVKIYKKYTKGMVPELRGFDEKDRAAILGTAVPHSQSQTQLHTQQPTPPGPGTQRLAGTPPIPTMPQPPFATREQSRDVSRYRASPGPPPSDTDSRGPASTSSSRLPSESPAPGRAIALTPPIATGQVFRPFAASDQHNLKPYASTEHMRSQGREPRSSVRPDTSPGPAANQGYSRQVQNGQLEPPAILRAQERSDSPTIAAQNRSPSRQRDRQDIIANDDRNHTAEEIPAIPTGAALFASSRQRLQQQQQQALPVPQQAIEQPVAQLPPIDVATQSGSIHKGLSPDRKLSSAHSTSSGLNSSDAAAFGAITSFWDADTAPKSQSLVSPPTPERSRRRPTIETKTSESSLDLRPAPLSQARKVPVSEPTSSLAPSLDISAPPSPIHEEPPEIKPLTVQPKSEQILSNPIASKFLSALTSKESAQNPTDDAEAGGEEFRPGLGPMIKKKVVAEKFRAAANTAKTFKPRPGGAAEKILKARAERDAMLEPDGINAVVPRPVIEQEASAPVSPMEPEAPKESPRVEVIPPNTVQLVESMQWQEKAAKHRSVELTDDTPRASLQPPIAEPESIEEQLPQPQIKIKHRSVQNERYITELGVDRDLLEGKGLEVENLLDEFGWRNGGLRSISIIDLEQNVKQELGRVEAGSWLSHTDATREEKVQQVEALLDKVIAECDELDGLLTLYSVELGSLNDDIAFIEAQSQGLQVQSANQKVLHSELQSLVQTMSLSRSVMEPLRYADMSQTDRLEEVESSLVKLYDALITMDPSMRSTTGRPSSRGGVGEIELSRMAALREKKEVYLRESAAFCQRLMQHLDSTFATSLNNIKGSIMRPISGVNHLNKDAYNVARSSLWMYSPVVLYTKEANPPAWQTIVRMYYTRVSPLYLEAFKENVTGWRRAARKPSPEEAEQLLFTHQEREGSEGVTGLTSTARKLTVKRSQTLAKTLRNATGTDKHHSPIESRNSGALMPSEMFAAALDEMAPLISQEQNFIVDMFHVTSLGTMDFVDSVTSVPPEERRGNNILVPKPMEPDREMARRTQGVMEEVFGFFTKELSGLLEWIVSNDPIQGVGVMAALNKHFFYLQDSSQEFLLGMLDQLLSKLRSLWAKFVDEQIRAIEDTKVKIHKRKGVIHFMKVFPPFGAAVENIFLAVAKQDYEGPADCVLDVRAMIDSAYSKINRAIFDSLKVIAKESPGPSNAKQGGNEDPEDKEMLNYYVLIIENMNHYIEEVDDGGKEGVLAEWRGRAMLERLDALEAYIARVTRRPLGKLLDFVESLESLMLSQPNASAIASRPSHSRKAARGVLSQYDGKELRRGIETLRRRIEKHFGEGDEEAISRSLVTFVTKECERSYEKIIDRVEALLSSVYPPTEGEKGVELEFGREDVRSGFRR